MADLSNLIAALRDGRVIDLSQTLEEHMPAYPTHSKYFHDMWSSYWHGGRSLTYQLVMNEHNGTHVDAPAHFISDAKPQAHVTIENVPLNRLIGRGVRIVCQEFNEGDYVPKAFVAEWEGNHGALQAGDIVIFDFGWAARWALRPNDRGYLTDWPGVSMEAAEYLLEKQVAAMGVDTLSPDPPAALASRPLHPVVLAALPDFFLFLALPLKIRGGSGSPIRAVAVV
jgi:kynurenine formamidase